MKKIIIAAIFSTISIFAKLNVIVSIPPQSYIVKQIAPNADITTIVTPGSSPHTYEPKPSQMAAVSRAKLYFAIGVEFEKAWLPKFKAQNSSLKIIHTDKNITKFPITQGEEAGEPDPHIWLSLDNLKTIAKNTANALIKADSKNRELYLKNLQKFLNKIEISKKDIEGKLSKLKNRKFITFHPSWGYFAKEFNLKQIAIEINGKEPSPKELIKIIKTAQKINPKAIFAEPEFSDKSANIIAKELKSKVIKISPLNEDVLKNLKNFANDLAD